MSRRLLENFRNTEEKSVIYEVNKINIIYVHDLHKLSLPMKYAIYLKNNNKVLFEQFLRCVPDFAAIRRGTLSPPPPPPQYYHGTK